MQITTSAQAAERDADAIASGIDSWALMHAAGQAAAQFIEALALRINARGITVLAGSGNNGGVAYVVAKQLFHWGNYVRVVSVGEPKTADARRAREEYDAARLAEGPEFDLVIATTEDIKFLVVDGFLGTGQSGALRSDIREHTGRANVLRDSGAGVVVSLDVPTGVNATTGEIVEDAIRADYTISFGTMKRAHVLQREQCGETVVVDIGLGEFAHKNDGAWALADETFLKSRVPKILSNAHKGSRGRVAIVGGTRGMAGAVVLASEAALRSGAGLLHAHVDAASVLPLQIAVPQAIAHDLSRVQLHEALKGMNAIVAGPGLGRSAESEVLLASLFDFLVRDPFETPVVLDADALTLVGTDVDRLKSLASSRQVVCTPHVGEFARLIGKPVADSLADRIAQAQEFANAIGVTLLLKGTPTVVAAPNTSDVTIVARGTPVLATGGSGDMLSGMIGTLLAQGATASDAACTAAWVHGRAAEIATEDAGVIRGVTLREVMNALPRAWRALSMHEETSPAPSAMHNTNDKDLRRDVSFVLTTLPRVWSEQ